MSDKGEAIEMGLDLEYCAGDNAGEVTVLVVDRRLHRQQIAQIGMASQLSGVPVATLIVAIEEHGVYEDDHFTIADCI
jgi:hypothetical protein